MHEAYTQHKYIYSYIYTKKRKNQTKSKLENNPKLLEIAWCCTVLRKSIKNYLGGGKVISKR